MNPETVIAIVCIAVALFVLFVVSRYLLIWLQAYFTGTRIRLIDLVLMSLRKVDPQVVVQCRVMSVQAELDSITTEEVEAHLLAGGDAFKVTQALIAAHRASIPLDWNTAAAIDLAGRNILEAVQVSVYPKVIDCPSPVDGQNTTLYGVTRDGIQLCVRVRVTVRTNVAQLIGGVTEATIIARVGEGVVSAIGSCQNYRQAVSDPLLLSRTVMARGLDSQSAFAIVSIDVADITVGRNLGAQLQLRQAEADIRISVARAEERRAAASAREQEMIALTRENEAAVVLAEAEIPIAMAAAWRSGQLTCGNAVPDAVRSHIKSNRRLRLSLHRQTTRPMVGVQNRNGNSF